MIKQLHLVKNVGREFKMPTPKKGETRSHFVGRCVTYVMRNEGITNSSHAAAKCHGIYDQHKKKSIINKIWDICLDILQQNKN